MNNTDIPPRWFQFVMEDAKRMERITRAYQDEDYGAMARMVGRVLRRPGPRRPGAAADAVLSHRAVTVRAGPCRRRTRRGLACRKTGPGSR